MNQLKKERKLLLFIHLCLLKRVLTQHDECDEVTTNSRMTSIIISTPSVYTALQCEDKCFREASCDGFNFKPMGTNDKYAKCELFKAEKSLRFLFAKGFSSRWLDRAKVREKWASASYADFITLNLSGGQYMITRFIYD